MSKHATSRRSQRKPRVFLSYSGRRSARAVKVVRRLLKRVLSVETFCTESDLRVGDLWRSLVHRGLNESDVVVSVLTPENCEAPWIQFEAGAFAAKLRDPSSAVFCYLLDMTTEDLPSTLSGYQVASANEASTRKLLLDIRVRLALSMSTGKAKRRFRTHWPRAWDQLRSLSADSPENDISYHARLVGVFARRAVAQTPFRGFIGSRILERASEANRSLAARVRPWHGEGDFLDSVTNRYLHCPVAGAEILAVCGLKNWGSRSVQRYFERNALFAKAVRKADRRSGVYSTDRTRVRRIFVAVKSRRHRTKQLTHKRARRVLRLHQGKKASRLGIQGRRLAMKRLVDVLGPESVRFVQRLKEGFGFIIIRRPEFRDVIAHIGFGDDLRASVFISDYVADEAIRVFECMWQHSKPLK